MRGVHFSLRWLFGVVSFLAAGCGLLIYASPLLSKLAFTAVVTVLLSAVSAAVYQPGDRRAFWGGFAVFGFAYLWMVCGTWQSPDGSNGLRERLVTTDLLIRCHEALPSRQTSVSMTPPTVVPGPISYSRSVAIDPYGNVLPPTASVSGYGVPGSFAVLAATVDCTDFLTTGQSLFAILFALLGGMITRQCSSRARASSSDASSNG